MNQLMMSHYHIREDLLTLRGPSGIRWYELGTLRQASVWDTVMLSACLAQLFSLS